jgi:pimeloyl-ACP methyl ester carboxylesterase
VERLLDALGYQRVDVLGVSLGGVVAQQLAHQAPERVRRLVLAATGPGLGGVPGNPRALLALATPRRYRQPDYYRRIAGRVYGGAAREDPDALLHGSPQTCHRVNTELGAVADAVHHRLLTCPLGEHGRHPPGPPGKAPYQSRKTLASSRSASKT